MNHKKSFYSIKHPRFFSLTFRLFAWFTVTFILRLLVNSKVPKFYFENLKMFCTLIFLDINTRLPIIYKKLYKNGIKCLMTRDFDVLNVSGIKYRVRCRNKKYLITFWKLSAWKKHLWVSMILNSVFLSLNYHFSLFNYNLNKNLLIRNL